MSLSPKRCLQNMADDLGRMREAQARYADLAARYPAADVSMDDVRLAQGDTAYYAQQAQTWAAAAQALLAGLERYAPDDADRDCHAPSEGRAPARGLGGRTSGGEVMNRPVLLDLFCGAGGAAMGYHRAGFDVVGVDIKPQPRYPFTFVQGDAMTYPLDGFDVIHASPPCQDHSPLRSRAGEHGTGWMLDATLARLAAQPALWVVENVGSADNRADLLLCAETFGLRTVRHRRFTIDPRFAGLLAVPAHPKRHLRRTSTKDRRAALAAGENVSVTGDVGSYLGLLCLGIDWMTGDELSQAIPPAFTQFIGEQLLAHLSSAVTP